jgi:hypothetical protein
MFLYSIVLAILLGFIFKGKLKDLGNIKLSSLYLVIIGYALDEIMHLMVKYGHLKIGIGTYITDMLMYVILFVFIYLNKKDFSILILGLGFFLNAVVIFTNGGAMPVSSNAMSYVSTTHINPATQGLYKLLTSDTKFAFLGDIISIKLLGHMVFSIGDIILSIGIMLLIIKGMRGNYNIHLLHSRGIRSRRNRRLRRNKLIKRSA